MKDYKRSYRRYKKEIKFLRRVKIWIKLGHSLYIKDGRIIDTTGQEVRESALKGECYTFLRTTGNPCNCYCCSEMNKYKREQRQYTVKNILKKDFDI